MRASYVVLFIRGILLTTGASVRLLGSGRLNSPHCSATEHSIKNRYFSSVQPMVRGFA